MIESSHLVAQIRTKSPSLYDQLERIVASAGGFEVREAGYPGQCDLLIVEIGGDIQEEFQLINRIQASGSYGEIFLTSQSTDPSLLISAMRLGIREFFSQPLREEDVKGALLKFKRRSGRMVPTEKVSSRQGQIINVLGAKGGVGTTTIAVNLATGLASLEGRPSVALIDMNLLFGEVPLFLNLKPVFDWLEVSRNISRLDATYLMSVLLKHSSGVHVLPSPATLIEDNAVAPEVIETLMKLMQAMFDFVVIDSGQSLDQLSKAILQLLDRLVLVTIPSLPGIINIKRLLETFRTLGYPSEDRIEIVVNRHNQKSGVSFDEAEKTLRKKIAWTVPNDYRNTMDAINSGEPLTVLAKNADMTKALNDMASNLAKREAATRKDKKRSFFGLLDL